MYRDQVRTLNLTGLEEALDRLGGALEVEEASPMDLVVVGGGAMLVSGAVQRATRDVDVIAILDSTGTETSAKPLPADLISAVRRVARDSHLPENWLNAGPADMQQWGLPVGWRDRAETRTYGDRLTVHFFGPEDLIPLKLFAVVDKGSGKHLDDLLALNPSSDDIVAAAQWCVSQDPSVGFFDMLCSVVAQLGYADALERISRLVDRPES